MSRLLLNVNSVEDLAVKTAGFTAGALGISHATTPEKRYE
jgi:hypothetical protein